MSISSAPSATAWRVSSSLSSIDVRPDGKPVATDATATPLPFRARTASGTRLGYTHSAAHDGTSGCVGAGQTALAASCATFPDVSCPSNVVRSTIEIASRIAACCEEALIDRLPSTAARSSTPTRSTGVSRRRMRPAYCGRRPRYGSRRAAHGGTRPAGGAGHPSGGGGEGGEAALRAQHRDRRDRLVLLARAGRPHRRQEARDRRPVLLDVRV